jgi:hypothetical protein
VADGTGGAERLTAILRALVPDPARRADLGGFGRRLAEERFSLARAARIQEEIYVEALAAARTGAGLPGQAGEAARSVAGVVAHKVRRRYRAARGTRASEDFNQVTLARAAMAEKP